jgi:hypothetical protein
MSSGWPASYPLLQPPNRPMLAAQALRLVAASTDGNARQAALAGYYAALGVWAYLELESGANAARRAIGAGVLGYVAARAGAKFAGR